MDLLRPALRQLRQRPGFASLSVAVLAIGLGAALALLEVADAVLLRPLPFANEERLANAWQADQKGGGARMTVSGADFLAWKAEAPGLERLAAVSARGFNLGGADRPERIEGAIVSADFFALLGTQPLLGRALVPGPPGARAAVLSEALWRARFGGEAGAVGRTISLDGEPVEVVGVMPAAFRYPSGADIWVSARARVPEHPTYPIDPEADRARHYLTIVARLKPGVSLEEAQAGLRLTQARLSAAFPSEDKDVGAFLVPLREQLFGSVRPTLLGLLGVSLLLLLVAWINVAHLFLARAVGRAHEVAVRVALGATRGALWKHFFAEALLVALSAGVIGLALAAWTGPLLVAASPQAAALPHPALGIRIVLAALVLSVACGASLGLLAALQPVRAAEALQEGGRTGTGGKRGARLRGAFLVFEVALSLVLLLGAGLLVRSFLLLNRVDPGFSPAGVLAADLPLPRARYPDKIAQARFATNVLRVLRADPLVDAAGFVSRLPLSPSNTVGDLTIPGREAEAFPLDLRLASAGYFEALRIPLREGRTFTDADVPEASPAPSTATAQTALPAPPGPSVPPVVVINETAARRAFPGRSALGERILVWGEEKPSEIVGVVGNIRHTGLDTEPRPEAWRPLGAVGWPNLALVLRGKVPAARLAPSVQAAVWGQDREQPIVKLQPMDERVDASLALRRFTLELLAAMAIVAVLLAAAGIHGVTAYLVAQRTRELGVRLALGATPWRLVRQVTGETMAQVAVGCFLGLAAGAGLTRLLRGFLFGVAPLDPATFAALPLLLAAASCLAAAAAAARAARVDPAEALRAQ